MGGRTRSRKTMFALSLLIVLQGLGAAGFISANASAQAEPLVVVIVGEKNQDACEVQYRRSDDGNWGAQTLDGPPQACSGGIVTAYITTEEEALQEGAALQGVARNAAEAEAVEVRFVQLTGNDTDDQVAVEAEIDAIHELFAPDVPDEEEALASDLTFAFMAPGALASSPVLADSPMPRLSPAAAVLAADCRTGRVGQERRADFSWQQKRIGGHGVRMKAYLFYKRISCRRWRITDVQVTQIDDYQLQYLSPRP